MSTTGEPASGGPPPRMPLATLIARELRGHGKDHGEPTVTCGHAGLAKKGEDDFLVKPDCQRDLRGSSANFSAFAVFDGHSGTSAALFAKEHLLDHVMSAIPEGLTREEWVKALPQALVAGFVKTDIEFQRMGETSGTTVTLVVVDGWTVTVASVGDSRCILDTQEEVVSLLTVDHRLEENEGEKERVTTSGGEVWRLNVFGGGEVGPLRCWPGGLCLSRSIGDKDVGEFIVPVPHVKQVRLPSKSGGRLIIASDGIWDALSSEVAAKSCRRLTAEFAARVVVKEALRTTGLKDDTTCLVVDILPWDHFISLPTPKKRQYSWRSLMFWKMPLICMDTATNKLSSTGGVEELFEEGSAVLAERLKTGFPSKVSSGLLCCAICQTDQEESEDSSINSSSYLSPSSNPWEGPFLCPVCLRKKDAMEGKKPRQPQATTQQSLHLASFPFQM